MFVSVYVLCVLSVFCVMCVVCVLFCVFCGCCVCCVLRMRVWRTEQQLLLTYSVVQNPS